MWMTLLKVAAGGAAGAVLRWALVQVWPAPLGTLLINAAGGLLIGILAELLAARGLAAWSPLLITGVLGGFTTFSAFSLDVWRMAEAGRAVAALAYVAGSVLLALGFCGLGLAIGRALA